MKKKIVYKKEEYEIEIKWGGQKYFFRVVGISAFLLLPEECLNDIEKFKPLIIQALNDKHDLKEIILWDGKIE